MKELVRLKIMAVQTELAGDRRAVLAMIRAREIGKEVTWQEAIAEDANERLQPHGDDVVVNQSAR